MRRHRRALCPWCDREIAVRFDLELGVDVWWPHTVLRGVTCPKAMQPVPTYLRRGLLRRV